MIYHLLVTEVGSQICVSKLSFQERTKILDSAHFFRENVIQKQLKSFKSSPVVKLRKLPTGPIGLKRNCPDLLVESMRGRVYH